MNQSPSCTAIGCAIVICLGVLVGCGFGSLMISGALEEAGYNLSVTGGTPFPTPTPRAPLPPEMERIYMDPWEGMGLVKVRIMIPIIAFGAQVLMGYVYSNRIFVQAIIRVLGFIAPPAVALGLMYLGFFNLDTVRDWPSMWKIVERVTIFQIYLGAIIWVIQVGGGIILNSFDLSWRRKDGEWVPPLWKMRIWSILSISLTTLVGGNWLALVVEPQVYNFILYDGGLLIQQALTAMLVGEFVGEWVVGLPSALLSELFGGR